MVKQIESEAEFAALTAKGVVLVDFYAVWCGPCQVIAPKIEELEAEHKGKVSFYKVDVDKVPNLAKSNSVTAMPTFVVFKDGAVRHTIVGADLNRITNAIKTLAQEVAAPAAASSS